jgi:hypothetical protein
MAGTPSFIVNKISTLRFAFFATTNKFIVIIAKVLDICQEFESFPASRRWHSTPYSVQCHQNSIFEIKKEWKK